MMSRPLRCHHKGVEHKTVVLDLYLLDMDREQAYEKRFPKKEAKKEMKLGRDIYRLLSVNDRTKVKRMKP